jgi:hypothetical protein
MGRPYVYRSILHRGWMVVASDGRTEFGPYLWKWQSRLVAWCLNVRDE